MTWTSLKRPANHRAASFLKMSLILTALVHLTILWLIGAILQAVYLEVIRVPVTRVQLFHGGTPLRMKVGRCEMVLGWIPVGSSVAYDPAEFSLRSIPIRLVGHFSSAIIVMGVACACLGWPQAWHHFLTGFRQIALGTWAPIDRATVYLQQWDQIAEGSPVAGFGILAAKSAAFYLFPSAVA